MNTNILEAERNRPHELASPARETDPETVQMRELVEQLLKNGLSPTQVADDVFNAIKDERFYILTHPQMTPVIEMRMRHILDGQNPTAVRYN